MEIINLFKNSNIDLENTITLSTNSGGVMTAQVYDALLFIQEANIKEELDFLYHLMNSKEQPSQESITSFLKHLFFNNTIAKEFVKWQRGIKVA